MNMNDNYAIIHMHYIVLELRHWSESVEFLKVTFPPQSSHKVNDMNYSGTCLLMHR